ncbi:hypothetical protein NIES4074_23370 [Cylindrospermum sp. NIES-4074]|nr:hypothetical protein NIES4074_23370 [Cylindrospermum sp. NIES-4074]
MTVTICFESTTQKAPPLDSATLSTIVEFVTLSLTDARGLIIIAPPTPFAPPEPVALFPEKVLFSTLMRELLMPLTEFRYPSSHNAPPCDSEVLLIKLTLRTVTLPLARNPPPWAGPTPLFFLTVLLMIVLFSTIILSGL